MRADCSSCKKEEGGTTKHTKHTKEERLKVEFQKRRRELHEIGISTLITCFFRVFSVPAWLIRLAPELGGEAERRKGLGGRELGGGSLELGA